MSPTVPVRTSNRLTGDDAWAAAARVVDPEMPMLTLADLGVLRDVETDDDGTVRVTITPTYTGCPALDAMRTDLQHALRAAGHDRVEVTVVYHPPWTTDAISEAGRRKLAGAGVAPPRHVGPRPAGPGTSRPVPLTLHPPEPVVTCPRCGADDTELVSRFGPTACTALRRCRRCTEPFEHVKELS